MVLFFDPQWRLVAKDEGFLSELLLRPQLPRCCARDEERAKEGDDA